MPGPLNAHRTRLKALTALSLAFTAGCVDIIGYISFGHLFTAHLTGETVHLGQGLFDAQWDQAARAGAVIAAFFAGSIVGRTVIEIGARYRIRNVATAGLILEAGLLGIVTVSTGSRLPPVVLLAGAMGVQTAILTRVGSLTVHTTFVTGMLNKLAQLLSHVCFLTYDVFRGSRNSRSARFSRLLEARFIFAVWACYLIGAAVGTGTRSRWGLHALLLPVGMVCMVAVADLIAPLAIEEERDVSER